MRLFLYRYLLCNFRFIRNLRVLQRRKATVANTLYPFHGSKSKVTTRLFSQSLFISFPSLFVVRFLGFSKQETEEEKTKKEMQSVLEEADRLYDELLHDKIYELLHPLKDNNDDEILWRLARAVYEKSKIAKSDQEKKVLYQEGYEYMKKAIEVNENSFGAHKWMSIFLDHVSTCEGTKERITQAMNVKHHMMRACELNPKDGTSYYLLGIWCYEVADLPWYQRKIAAVIYATPPNSSYEEALNYFEKGEEVEPNFYSKNLLMIGKCYLKLGEKEQAKNFLCRARDFSGRTFDDDQAKKEATELLKGLNV